MLFLSAEILHRADCHFCADGTSPFVQRTGADFQGYIYLWKCWFYRYCPNYGNQPGTRSHLYGPHKNH